MTEGCSKGRQKSRSPESNHVITIITTSPNVFDGFMVLNSAPYINIFYLHSDDISSLFDVNVIKQQCNDSHCNAIVSFDVKYMIISPAGGPI